MKAVLLLLLSVTQPHFNEQSSSQRFRKTPDRFTTSATTMVNRAQVLILESVRAELKLSDEQRQQIDVALVDWSKREAETASRLPKTASREEGMEVFAKSRADAAATWEKILELLTPDQETRFEQLTLQKKGLRIFVTPPREFFTQLNINREQREQFKDIYLNWEKRYGLPERGTKSWVKLTEQFLAVLTKDQREKWQTLIGEPFDFQETGGRRGGGFSARYPNLGGDASMLFRERVRHALELSEEQSTQVDAANDRWQKARDEVQQKFRSSMSRDEFEKVRESLLALTDLAVEITDQIMDVLTKDQQARLRQVALQEQGIRAFLEPATLRSLDLSTSQQRRISQLATALLPSFSPAGERLPAPSPEKRRELMAQVLEVLTAEQREKWASMIGKPTEIPEDPLVPPAQP